LLMALTAPVVEAPDTTALMESLKARSSQLANDAWGKFQESYAQTRMRENPPPSYEQAIGGWGHPADMVAGQGGAHGSLTHASKWNGYSKDTEGVRNAFNGRLKELGMPDHMIEAVGWNVQDESGWNPGVVGDGGHSFGLIQWYKDRKEAAVKYAQELGMDPADPVFQANNVWREMNGPYKGVYEKAVATGQPHLAADILLRQYEIPAAEHIRRRSAAYLSRGGSMPQQAQPRASAQMPISGPGGYQLAISSFGQ
jgi:hypothetical protein